MTDRRTTGRGGARSNAGRKQKIPYRKIWAVFNKHYHDEIKKRVDHAASDAIGPNYEEYCELLRSKLRGFQRKRLSKLNADLRSGRPECAKAAAQGHDHLRSVARDAWTELDKWKARPPGQKEIKPNFVGARREAVAKTLADFRSSSNPEFPTLRYVQRAIRVYQEEIDRLERLAADSDA